MEGYIMELFERNDTSSLTDKVFNRIREDIITGVLKNGEKLVEARIADSLDVSRTPVREALKQLEREGLLESTPNKGFVVKSLSLRDIEDIYEMRMSIEGIAAGWAVDRMKDETIDELKELYELMEFYTMKKDVEKIFELNTRFHETIYKAACSRYLEHVLKDFQFFIKVTRKKSLGTKGRLPEALKEHRDILDAFIEKDRDKVVEMLVRHIKTAKENVRKLD